MNFRIRILLLNLAMILLAVPALSQNSSAVSVKASAELVSSYIWRGTPAITSISGQPMLAPHLQPTVGLAISGFEIGAWGSTDFTGSYQELDLYALYSFKGITATVTDYFWVADWATKPYFLYKNETTGHIIEVALAYEFSKIPLSISAATMIFGNDKRYDPQPVEGKPAKNNFSTYIEMGYAFKVSDYNFDAFVGVTPADGFYGDGYGNKTGFGVVNTGLTVSKKIKLSEKIETTFRSSLIFNPQNNKAYLVLGISI